jgi:hypothetical protein
MPVRLPWTSGGFSPVRPVEVSHVEVSAEVGHEQAVAVRIEFDSAEKVVRTDPIYLQV